MQQVLIDGAEAGIAGLDGYSIQKDGKYVYQAEHSIAPAVWSMSASVFNSLSEKNQKIIIDTFNKYSRFYGERGLETQNEHFEKMKAECITFVQSSAEDKAAMSAAAKVAMAASPSSRVISQTELLKQ